MRKINQLVYVLMLVALIHVGSCRKFVEVEAPYTSFTGENVYTTDATAISAVTSMYAQLGTVNYSIGTALIHSVTYYAGLSADELVLYSGSSAELTAVYSNNITTSTVPLFWQRFYQ